MHNSFFEKHTGMKLSFKINRKLYYLGIFYIILLEVLCLFMVLFAEINAHFIILNTTKDRRAMQVLFILLAIAAIVAFVLCLPRWSATVVLTKDNIKVKRVFHKTEMRSYSEYNYIYRAYQLHRFVIFNKSLKEYIILSKAPVATELLQNARKLPCSSDTIKIRYRANIYADLSELFPQQLKRKLVKAFNTGDVSQC